MCPALGARNICCLMCQRALLRHVALDCSQVVAQARDLLLVVGSCLAACELHGIDALSQSLQGLHMQAVPAALRMFCTLPLRRLCTVLLLRSLHDCQPGECLLQRSRQRLAVFLLCIWNTCRACFKLFEPHR